MFSLSSAPIAECPISDVATAVIQEHAIYETPERAPNVCVDARTGATQGTFPAGHAPPVFGAGLELDMTGYPVVLFRNAAHGGLAVVYRRPDGNVGWIDPERTSASNGKTGGASVNGGAAAQTKSDAAVN